MPSRRLCIGILASSIALILLFAAPDPVRSQSRTISMNHARIDITQLIKNVGVATGRTILFDDSVRGVVSLVAKRPVTPDEAWLMLGTALSTRGFTMLPSTEGNWRVAKVADAVGESPFRANLDSARHAYVTSLIPLRVASPDAVMGVLEPLAGASVTLVPLTKSNALIASGPERRIARLTILADAIDRIDERPIGYRVIRYRNVDEIVEWLESIFDAGSLSRKDVEIWSDTRTNSLIYRADAEDERRLKVFIERFDRPIEGEGRVRVLRVLNRDPQELADLIGSMRDSSSGPLANIVALASRTALTGSDYSIAVDPPTRSLVVRADQEVHAEIQRLVEELDAPPQLIAVDLKVTEIRTPSAFALGFAFNIPLAGGDDEGEIIARLVSTPAGGGLAATPGPETTVFSRVDQELNLPFTVDDGTGIAIPINNTGVLTAGDRKVRTEVLIEPSLVVTAGDTHEIFVGENIPIPVQSGSATDSVENSSLVSAGNVLRRETTIERRDIGIKLTIDVQATRVGPIILDLDIELSSLSPSIAGLVELVGPTFTEQKFAVHARLDDGEAAIVALNRDRTTTKERDGTPFLSALPFVGWAFTNVVERDEDTRLVIAAQAKRVSSPAALAADTIRRRLAFERRNSRDAALPVVADDETGFAVLVTTRTRRDDADAIAQGLDLQGYSTEIHQWELRDRELFDVYVTMLESMSEAAEVASDLNADGWNTNLTLLPTRS